MISAEFVLVQMSEKSSEITVVLLSTNILNKLQYSYTILFFEG